jgi:two-component system phosphate regulon sensor histidine kinase PhoR
VRLIGAAATLAAGTAAALALGAPALAAGAFLLGGAAALAFAVLGRRGADPAPPVAGESPGLGAVADAIDEPLLLVRERQVLFANAAAKTLLGGHIERSDVRLAIRHPAATERLGDAHQRETERIELVGLGEAGRPWEMLVSPLPDGSRLVRLVDQSQARAAEQIRVDFVANASHELRTPLATLLGFLETLEDEAAAGDAATRDRFLRIMFGEATRMRDLLDDLMSLSRIEAERFAAPRGIVDLGSLIEEVRAAVKPLAQGRRIRVENRVGDAIVNGDPGQLAQLLNNLLVNALKYGRSGTQVRILLEDAADDLVALSVIDRGEGIPADHIPRLTERFYRVDPGRSRQVGGTGLGLAIAKHIVLRHRGRLEIGSRMGVGTTVRVTLPRALHTPAVT